MAEERVYKTTEAQRRATAKRMAKMDSVSFWLTPEEKEEQAALRQEYINEIRLSFGATLENTVIQRPDGQREKLKKQK